MKENFITHIRVNQARNVSDLDIPLSKDKRQHLIITGKNGSGKTSLLLELDRFLNKIEANHYKDYAKIKHNKRLNKLRLGNSNSQNHAILSLRIDKYEKEIATYGGTEIEFSDNNEKLQEKYNSGQYLMAFFDAKRTVNLNVPKGISKVNLKEKYKTKDKINQHFIQYIVNLKADRSFARDDNETDTVKKIDDWFTRLENRLKFIFAVEHLKLKFDRKKYNFEIVTGKNEVLNFSTLSDGYSAIISIITEIIMRMEAHQHKAFDLEGVVLIDEIETHLHVDLQKKILPFLTDFFPKLQFIVTTHSPFVLSSLSNATICDLEKKIVTTDLSGYSYDTLLESYFETDKYSEEVKTKVSRLEELMNLSEKTVQQKEELLNLKDYFDNVPKYLSTARELTAKLQELELKELLSSQK